VAVRHSRERDVQFPGAVAELGASLADVDMANLEIDRREKISLGCLE
jgi:hypothetical protein